MNPQQDQNEPTTRPAYYPTIRPESACNKIRMSLQQDQNQPAIRPE